MLDAKNRERSDRRAGGCSRDGGWLWWLDRQKKLREKKLREIEHGES